MNFNTEVTASLTLQAERQEYITLDKLLNAEDGDHGFQLEYQPKTRELYLFAEENGDSTNLPAGFLELFGKLIEKNSLKYLEFGVAFTASRMAPGSRGGTSFRIHTDGIIEYPTIIWSDDNG